MQALACTEGARHVRGPVSAVIAMLLPYKWSPILPSHWQFQHGGGTCEQVEWHFNESELTGDEDFSDILADLSASVMGSLWQQAASHYCGEGMAGGIDNDFLRALLSRLGQAPKGAQWAETMLAVATGGTWPRTRFEVDDPDFKLCPWCLLNGEHHPETPLHRCWLCPQNTGHQAYRDSDQYVPQAVSQHEQYECFWFRGLLPSSWTEVPSPSKDERWIFEPEVHTEDHHSGGHR